MLVHERSQALVGSEKDKVTDDKLEPLTENRQSAAILETKSPSDFDTILDRYGEELEPFMRTVTFPKSRAVYVENVVANRFYRVIKGGVLLALTNADGQLIPVYRATPNGEINVFGLESLQLNLRFVVAKKSMRVEREESSSNAYTTSAYAQKNTVVQEMSPSSLKRILEEELSRSVDQTLLLFLMKQYSEVVRYSQYQFTKYFEVNYRAAKLHHKIAHFLFNERMRNKTDVINMSHQDLAVLLATHRESITLALARLKKLGVVETSREGIKITNPELLEEYARSLIDLLGLI